jgi:hypothetical protein
MWVEIDERGRVVVMMGPVVVICLMAVRISP